MFARLFFGLICLSKIRDISTNRDVFDKLIKSDPSLEDYDSGLQVLFEYAARRENGMIGKKKKFPSMEVGSISKAVINICCLEGEIQKVSVCPKSRLKFVKNWKFPDKQLNDSVTISENQEYLQLDKYFIFRSLYPCDDGNDLVPHSRSSYDDLELSINGTLRWIKHSAENENSTEPQIMSVNMEDYCFLNPIENNFHNDQNGFLPDVAICQRFEDKTVHVKNDGVRNNRMIIHQFGRNRFQNNYTKNDGIEKNQSTNDRSESDETKSHQPQNDRTKMNRTINSDSKSGKNKKRQSKFTMASPISRKLVRIISCILSISLLIIIFVIYACQSKLRRNYGIIFMMYVTSVFITTIIEFLHIFGSHLLRNSRDICITFGFVWHYFHFSRIFWGTLLCFNIWRNFRGISPLFLKKIKGLVICLIYGWGCPAIFTGISLILEFQSGISGDSLKPKIGLVTCWFESSTAEKILAIHPVTFLCLFNVTLFISTAWNIYKQRKNIKCVNIQADSQSHGEVKHWMIICMKLFIFMGINWIIEIIQWKIEYSSPGKMHYVIIWITDVYNAFQGVIVFIVFDGHEKLKRLILRRRNFHQNETSFKDSPNISYIPEPPTSNTEFVDTFQGSDIQFNQNAT